MLCILINSKDFDLQSKINLLTCIKNYTTFLEQNFADSQQGHIERLFFVTMVVSKVYAIYLRLCLFLHAYRPSNKKMSTYSDNRITMFIISVW